MLDRLSRPYQPPEIEPRLAAIEPGALIEMTRRQWPLILAMAGMFLLAGVAYWLLAQPRYSAAATLMIDTRRNQLFQAQQVVSEMPLDSPAVESQAEILRSEGVARAVVKALKLDRDEDFSGNPAYGARHLLRRLLAGDSTESDAAARERRALARLDRGLKVKRLGLTHVIEIGFSDTDPARAAAIANAVGEAYITGELDARFQATQRAGLWLQARMGELRAQATQADAAVASFKTEHNLVETGRGLVSEQQLGDVNAQLIQARAASAELGARLARIREIASVDMPNAAMSDALRSEVISRLRSQYLDIAAREANWSGRYGRDHLAAVDLRRSMGELRHAIRDEIGRIGQSLESEHKVAQVREASLQQSLAGLMAEAATTGQAQVRLRELESVALSSRTLHASFQQRFMEAAQQQSFPMSEARILTVASAPEQASWPRAPIVFAGSLMLGLMTGLAAAFLRERTDRMVRSPQQARDITGLDCLGVLPRVGAPAASPDQPIDPALLQRYSLAAPFSRFTETLRGVKVAVDLAALTRQMQVIGLASALPQEGKTTIAANLAALIAHAGARTLLIDTDLRNPSLTRTLAPERRCGLLDILAGEVDEREAIWRDPGSELHMMPSGLAQMVPHTPDLISSPRMAELLERLREVYDYIILDMPPLIPVVDTKAAGRLVDGFVLVVEWGATATAAIEEALDTVEVVRERGIGVVLNKADPAALRRLEHHRGRHADAYYRDPASAQISSRSGSAGRDRGS